AFFSTRIAEGLMAGLPGAGSLARLWVLGGSEISSVTLSRFVALHVLVVPAVISAVVVWRMFRAQIAELFTTRDAIVGGLVFLALALWAWKNPASLGPPAAGDWVY